jgi:hypothetical protein
MSIAMVPMPSVLDQTSIPRPRGGAIAIVEITVGMIGGAGVPVAMTPMTPVLMPALSPQWIRYGPTFAVVVDGLTRRRPVRGVLHEHGTAGRIEIGA